MSTFTLSLNSSTHEYETLSTCTVNAVHSLSMVHLISKKLNVQLKHSISMVRLSQWNSKQCNALSVSHVQLLLSATHQKNLSCITLSLQICMKLFTQMQIQSWQSSAHGDVSQGCGRKLNLDNLQVQLTRSMLVGWRRRWSDYHTPWWWMEAWRSSWWQNNSGQWKIQRALGSCQLSCIMSGLLCLIVVS